MLTTGKVLIAGGSGFIGSILSKLLIKHNYEVAILSRHKLTNSAYKHFQWDIDNQSIQEEAFEGVNYIINLAGANIAESRWTKKQKQKILESRSKAATLLFNSTQKLKTKPLAYIAASAVGYYGSSTTDHIYKEDDPNGNDFLASVCNKWEEVSYQFEEKGMRTVVLRTGVVFDKDLGAFPKMTQTLKFGFVSGIGSGKQYIPWIHIDDLANIYLSAIENQKLNGIYNAVAPTHLTQNDLTYQISKLKNKVKAPNIPGIFLKLALGEMSSILLNGSRISAQKIIDTGFKFKHPEIKNVLDNLL